MNDRNDPSSLKSTFASAEQVRLKLESGAHATTSSTYADLLTGAIQGYQSCLTQISHLSLFSPNESAEDISTSDLPYLLASYHLADLLQKTPNPSASPSERRRILSAARDAYERFLHQLDAYGLLSAPQAALLARYADDPRAFATAASADPTARRDAKITSFRAEKELRQRLDYLRARPEYGTGDGGGDEDVVRETHLAHLAWAAHTAFAGLEGLNRELDVLSEAPEPLLPPHGAAEEADERARLRAGTAEDGETHRVSPPLMRLRSALDGPLLSREGKPLQPFTLLGGSRNRQEIGEDVFRPGHNLPTMTIDEYLAEERRRGGIIEGGGEKSWQRPEPDEDDYDKADAETMAAREWDDFAEANPRGSGNTLNRG